MVLASSYYTSGNSKWFHSICRFFHETQKLFESFWNTQNWPFVESDIFSNTQTQRFFDSENFQIPRTSGSLVLIFFSNTQNQPGLQKSNTRPTLVHTPQWCYLITWTFKIKIPPVLVLIFFNFCKNIFKI